jgi:hypothetical protein
LSYITDEEALAALNISVAANTPEVEAARLAAEQAIDAYCLRTFAVPTAATTRTFVPVDRYLLEVPDIASTSGLTIVSDGVSVSSGDYQLEYAPGKTGFVDFTGRAVPATLVRLLTGWWVFDDGEATISITARWGWPATPPEVKVAAKLLTKDFYQAGDLRFGFADVGEFGRRVAQNGMVAQLLGPLRRAEAWGVA